LGRDAAAHSTRVCTSGSAGIIGVRGRTTIGNAASNGAAIDYGASGIGSTGPDSTAATATPAIAIAATRR
jgi:hypothetical protein